jgi:hypothetical protein
VDDEWDDDDDDEWVPEPDEVVVVDEVNRSWLDDVVEVPAVSVVEDVVPEVWSPVVDVVRPLV